MRVHKPVAHIFLQYLIFIHKLYVFFFNMYKMAVTGQYLATEFLLLQFYLYLQEAPQNTVS